MVVKILLRQVRDGKKLSMNEMARLTGLSPQYLGRLENNKGNPSLATLDILCKHLEVQPGDLLKYEET